MIRHPRNDHFIVELIQPSFYDEDGYVIQWVKGIMPSNSLAALNGLALDAVRRRLLGADVEFEIHARQESVHHIPVEKIIRNIQQTRYGGVVCMVGVMCHHLPRAFDLAMQFRRRNIQVIIGGAFVSSVIATIGVAHETIRELSDAGISVFAGEAEDGRFDQVLRDAFSGNLASIYDYSGQTTDLQNAPVPYLSKRFLSRFYPQVTIDFGRGCPFNCDFCSIIHIHGHESRSRTEDAIDEALRHYIKAGIHIFFVADDNFARNRHWEQILDRLIEIQRQENRKFALTFQVDIQSARIPGFIDKCALAGCRWVFIGIESFNPANLQQVNKKINNVDKYPELLMAWRKKGIEPIMGYIIGFPNDSVASIQEDIKKIHEELPCDIFACGMMTPHPGTVLHKKLVDEGVGLEPDYNCYNSEYPIIAMKNMSRDELQDMYHWALDWWYAPEQLDKKMRLAYADHLDINDLFRRVLQFYVMHRYSGTSAITAGFIRRKIQSSRRPGLPRENRLSFFLRRLGELWSDHYDLLTRVRRLRKQRLQLLKELESTEQHVPENQKPC